jgi:hypothetical protein
VILVVLALRAPWCPNRLEKHERAVLIGGALIVGAVAVVSWFAAIHQQFVFFAVASLLVVPRRSSCGGRPRPRRRPGSPSRASQ